MNIVRHPLRDCDTNSAIRLAQQCRHPDMTEGLPDPTVDEAMDIIRETISTREDDWPEGRTAMQVLMATKGMKVRWN